MAKQPKWMLFKANGTVVPFNKKEFDSGKYENWEPAPIVYPAFVDAALEVPEAEAPAKRGRPRKVDQEQPVVEA